MTISRIYHSREDRINEIHGRDERVSYDDPAKDYERVTACTDLVGEYTDDLMEALDEYSSEIIAPVDEDSESRMRYARQTIVEKWALAQGAISKVAWVLRINGNDAYEKMIEAIKTGAAMDMRGL